MNYDLRMNEPKKKRKKAGKSQRMVARNSGVMWD